MDYFLQKCADNKTVKIVLSLLAFICFALMFAVAFVTTNRDERSESEGVETDADK